MDPVSFACGVLGAADVCLKSGKYLIRKFGDYRNAERDIVDIVLRMKTLWLKTEIQLESIKKLWGSFDPRLQALFDELIGHLQSKLQIASNSLDRVMDGKQCEGGAVKKFKAAYFKKSIQQTVQELEDWQGRFEPTWLLITLVTSPAIDRYLEGKNDQTSVPTGKLKELRDAMSRKVEARQGSIFIKEENISGGYRSLPWSEVCTTRLSGSDKRFLIDKITYLDSDINLATVHIRDLARRLSTSDPAEFGVLRCRGVIKSSTRAGTSFKLVFEIPPTLSSPQTLREILLHKAPHPLNQRFQLAKQLIRSLMFVHTFGFVHKSIRPDTIIVFRESEKMLGHSFLTGFERFRPGNAETLLSGDSSWEKNLYRHPKRQGIHPEERYIMQHDIYSLGVCLLEIGLWNSFVRPADGSGIESSESLKNVKEALVSGNRPSLVKDGLVQIATKRLSGLMGQRYADIVLSCLTCLDPGDTNLFGKEEDLEDEDGIVVGVQFIEKVLSISPVRVLFFANYDCMQVLLQIEDIRV
ncbi:unnamed protein product [Penicillium salamii]|uniref:Protein kinase domain-containing protein n=1 Tax=Penicillium salamii TaxID=1612424 RepID=A0A9W4NV58_9EURO|nr:unnamed protein product [Penicillium salamii]CAG8395564.1 unnamed protein product [Penicillium salamii]CAG8414731.1 unnamed protein product [Penicillium salamii]CAG8419969.1 unnamed protein product [Penicillium salamii]